MITRERVVEIFKEVVKRDPQTKDIMAISSMARNTAITEEVIAQTFQGLKDAEDNMAKYLEKEKAKTIPAIINNKKTEIPVEPLVEDKPTREDTDPDIPAFRDDEEDTQPEVEPAKVYPTKEELEEIRFGDLIYMAKNEYGLKVSRGTSKKKLISAIVRKIKKLEA